MRTSMIRQFILLAVLCCSQVLWGKFEEPCSSLLTNNKFGPESSSLPSADAYRNPQTGYYFKRMAVKYRILDPLIMTGAYPSEEEMATYQVLVQDGKLVWREQFLGGKDCRVFTFVMMPDGRIYADAWPPKGRQLHHSALARGQAIAAAGELSACDGVIGWVNNRSGHYLPPVAFHSQLLHRLKAMGYKGPQPRLFDRDNADIQGVPEVRERALQNLINHNSKIWHSF